MRPNTGYRTGKRYQVHCGGKRYRYFDTMEEASAFCNEVHARTKVILSIVALW